MINVNEYRLGLIVMDAKPYDKLYKIDIGMLINAVSGIPYRPVQLTPEWLERCGFEDMGTYWQYNGEPGFVLLKDKEGVAYIGNPVRTYVKTVHHLQNLYFALTEGVELNIEL